MRDPLIFAFLQAPTEVYAAWTVAIIAIATIIFHAGYTWQTLAWLKENAATKADLALLRSERMADFDARFEKLAVRKQDLDVLRAQHTTEMEDKLIAALAGKVSIAWHKDSVARIEDRQDKLEKRVDNLEQR